MATLPWACLDLVLFYHPCISGVETLPLKAPYEPTLDTDPSSLIFRNPGLTTFWPTLGRLLPNSKLPSDWRNKPLMTRLPFMQEKGLKALQIAKSAPGLKDVPEKTYDRVKGFAFFNRAFKATEHKLELNTKHETYVQLIQELEGKVRLAAARPTQNALVLRPHLD
jgi:hypothetical protein